MRLLLLAIIFFGSSGLQAQERSSCDSVYQYVDEELQFEGGSVALMKWITDNLVQDESVDMGEHGTVRIEMTIDSHGEIMDLKIHSALFGSNASIQKLRENALKITPAKINGKPVCSKVLIPMCILLY